MNSRALLTGDHVGAIIGGGAGGVAYFRFVFDRLSFLPGTGEHSSLVAVVGFGIGFLADQVTRRRHRGHQVQIGLALLSGMLFVGLFATYDFLVEWATKNGYVEGVPVLVQYFLLLLVVSSWSAFWCSAFRFGWLKVSS